MEDDEDIVRSLFGGGPKHRTGPRWTELDPSSVTHDKLDEGTLSDLRQDAERFEPMFEAPEIGDDDTPYESWEALAADIFYVYHTYDHPQLRSEDEMRQSHRLHRRIIEKVIHSEGFAAARRHTRLDAISAALASLAVSKTVRELLQDELEEAAERAQEAAEAEQRHDEAAEANDRLREQVAEQGGQLTDEQRQQMRANAQARAAAAAALADQATPAPMNAQAAEAIAEAAGEAKDELSAIGSLPGTGTGQVADIPPAEAFELARKIQESTDAQEVLKRFGRFERDMRYERTNRVVGGREEIVDVETGGDISRALPSELVKLGHPLLKLDFLRRIHEASLLQYETVGADDAGRGPIVMAIDVSGSMGGEKNWWARGTALGLLAIAHREGRSFCALEFDTTIKGEYEFPGRRPIDPRLVIEFAARGVGGGTDITAGLRRGGEIILTAPEFRTADLVIATDGQDSVDGEDHALRDQLSAAGVRLHGVAIGVSSNAWLDTICDDQVSAYELSDPSAATAHLAKALT
jgi:uncharacterized protein with von Willebrand factor type A (vWA) domain